MKTYQNIICVVSTLIAILSIFVGIESARVYYELKEIPQITIEKEVFIQDKALESENEQLISENELLKKDIVSLEQELKLCKYSDSEKEILMRIAASEAGTVSAQAQKNVVFVILNRVHDERFPNNIYDVTHAPGQFAVVKSGAYKKVKITEELKLNIDEAILEFNYGESAEGAIFFAKGRTKGREYLFTDEVGHVFEK